jgi:hypothetical protein
MGDEIEYTWNFILDCPQCKKYNAFDIVAYEYPPSVMNWKDYIRYTASIRFSDIKFGGCDGCEDFNNEGNEDE